MQSIAVCVFLLIGTQIAAVADGEEKTQTPTAHKSFQEKSEQIKVPKKCDTDYVLLPASEANNPDLVTRSVKSDTKAAFRTGQKREKVVQVGCKDSSK